MPDVRTSDYIEFIALLRKARRRCGLTQIALGTRLGKPQTFVSKVETCERRLDFIEAARWCVALGIRLEDALPLGLKTALDRAAGRRGP